MTAVTATTTIPAAPEQVLKLLIDPDACAAWSPVAFELDALDGPYLDAGSRARVSGALAGRRLTFDVLVHRADEYGVELEAAGAFRMDVRYALRRIDGGTELRADVAVGSAASLTGRLLLPALKALLAAGVLGQTLARISAAASECECVATA